MNLTKNSIGNLINRYKAVLKKCSLMNVFGSLAVAGMLVAGGVSGASALELAVGNNDLSSTVTGTTVITTNGTAVVSKITGGANTAGTASYGTSAQTGQAKIEIDDNMVTGAVTIVGTTAAGANDTIVTLNAGKAYTVGVVNGTLGTTTIGVFGNLILETGSIYSTSKTTIADTGSLKIAGTHKGAVEVAGASNAKLIGAGGKVWGDVTVGVAGVIDTSTEATGGLTVLDSTGDALGKLTLTNATLTLGTGDKALTVGTLVLSTTATDHTVGELNVQEISTTSDAALTLKGGTLSFKDIDGELINGTLNSADFAFNTGGVINAKELTLDATLSTSGMVNAADGDLTITAESLNLAGASKLGVSSSDLGNHTLNLSGAGTASFLNKNLTIIGAAGFVGKLVLDDGGIGTTAGTTSAADITLAGKTLVTDAVLGVEDGDFTLNKVIIDNAADGFGSITVANGAELNLTGLDVKAAAGFTAEATVTTTGNGIANLGAVNLLGLANSKTGILNIVSAGLTTATTITGDGDANGKVSLVVGGNLVADTLNFDANSDLTFASASGGGNLTVTNLTLGATSTEMQYGTLNIKKSEFAFDKTKFTAAGDGTINVMGALKVAGNSSLANLTLGAKSYVSSADLGDVWDATGSHLIIYGEGGTTESLVANSGTFTVSSTTGGLQLGGVNVANPLDADNPLLTTLGGTITDTLVSNVADGIKVYDGTWNLGAVKIANATGGSFVVSAVNSPDHSTIVDAGAITLGVASGSTIGTLTVSGGADLTVDSLTTLGSGGNHIISVDGNLTVEGTFDTATNGGTAVITIGSSSLSTLTLDGTVKTEASTVTIGSMGELITDASNVIKNLTTPAAADDWGSLNTSSTGVLTITGASGRIDFEKYKNLSDAIVGSNSDVTLNVAGLEVNLTEAESKLDIVEGYSLMNNVVAVDADIDLGNTTTSVKGLNAGSADKTVTFVGGSVLTLKGGAEGFDLDDGVNNVNFDVDTATSVLNLGNVAGGEDGKTYGNLSGTITLGDAASKLNVVNGDFTVGGISTIDNTKGVVSVSAGKLTSKSDIEVLSVVLNGGTLVAGSTSDVAADRKDLNVGTTGITVATDGVAGNVYANNITVTTGGIVAGMVNATGTIDSAADVTVNSLVADKLTAGADLTMDNTDKARGIFILSGAEANTITGTMDLTNVDGNVTNDLSYTAASTITDSTLIVGGTLTATHDLTIKESAVEVGTFESDAAKKYLVGDADDTDGSSLIIDNYKASQTGGAIIFVDPANAKSTLQIKAVDATNKWNDIAVGSNNSYVIFGDKNEAWAAKQASLAGFNDVSSTFVLAENITMGTAGQILIGDKYNVDGEWDGAQSADVYGFALRGDSLMIVSFADIYSTATAGIVLDAGKSTVQIDSTASLLVAADGVKLTGTNTAQTVTLISGVTEVNGGTIADGDITLAKVASTNILLDIDKLVYTGDAAGEQEINVAYTEKKMTDIMPSLDPSLAGLVTAVGKLGFDTDHTNRGQRFISQALDSRFIDTSNTKLIETTIEGATKLGVAGGVASSITAIGSAGSTNAQVRTSLAGTYVANATSINYDGETVQLSAVAGSAEGMQSGFGLWVMPMYQNHSAKGLESGNFEYGYDTDFYGVSIGADYTVANNFRFGAAFNIGAGTSDSKGDFAKTENDFDYYGFSAYAGYHFNNIGISADLGYTISSNDIDQSSALGKLSADTDAYLLTAGLRAEYLLATEVLDIIPHVGIRINSLSVDSFNTDFQGGVAFATDSSDSTTVQFPIGVTLAKTITTSGGWNISPSADIGVMFTTGDTDISQDVRIPGIATSASMDSDIYDVTTFQGGLGLSMSKDNFSIALDYNLNASEHVTSHGVFGTLRYEF